MQKELTIKSRFNVAHQSLSDGNSGGTGEAHPSSSRMAIAVDRGGGVTCGKHGRPLVPALQ